MVVIDNIVHCIKFDVLLKNLTEFEFLYDSCSQRWVIALIQCTA